MEGETRHSDLAAKVDAFLEASIRDWTGRAVQMLADTPEIAGYDARTALVLGDVDRVRQLLGHDPGLATRARSRVPPAPVVTPRPRPRQARCTWL